MQDRNRPSVEDIASMIDLSIRLDVDVEPFYVASYRLTARGLNAQDVRNCKIPANFLYILDANFTSGKGKHYCAGHVTEHPLPSGSHLGLFCKDRTEDDEQDFRRIEGIVASFVEGKITHSIGGKNFELLDGKWIKRYLTHVTLPRSHNPNANQKTLFQLVENYYKHFVDLTFDLIYHKLPKSTCENSGVDKDKLTLKEEEGHMDYSALSSALVSRMHKPLLVTFG